MDLSIIVPVYNVEQYVVTCVESLFCQDLTEGDFEVILVDDGSTDGSFDRLGPLLEAHPDIVVVRQENQGLSAARNAGLQKAKGEYVLFVDSDDLLIAHTLKALVEKAMAEQADLLVAGFVKRDDQEIARGVAEEQREGVAGYEATTGSQLFTRWLNPAECYVWRTLYRRQFLEEEALRFVPGIYFEDVPFTTECYLKAKRAVVTSRVFYVYRQRPGSIVSSVSMRKVTDMNEVMARLCALRQEMALSDDERRKLDDTLFTTFSIAVWYVTHDADLTRRRHEYTADLQRRVGPSGLHFSNGWKQRAVSLFFRLFPNTYIYLRSLK